jgi:hypothetical protein
MKKINNLLANLEKMAENSPGNITNLNNLAVGKIRGGKVRVIENNVCTGGVNANCHNGTCEAGPGGVNGTCTNDTCAP